MNNLKERLQEIVETSYRLLCNKIVGGAIDINAEASLQHNFGLILATVGHLYEYGKHDRLLVYMEKDVDIQTKTWKSDDDARIDIFLVLTDGNETCRAAIEMKYFPKSSSEASTDNRFFILGDIENLEAYQTKGIADIGYLMIFTTNQSYTCDDNSYVKLGNGEIPIPAETRSRNRQNEIVIRLNGNYRLQWNNPDEDKFFLLQMIDLNNNR